MSKTLKVASRLLAVGRRLHDFGLFPQAIRVLKRVAALPELPRDVALEAQQRLAQIHIQRQAFGRARRHLAAVMQYEPHDAETQYLMGWATDEDAHCDSKRALLYYKRAIELDPDEADYLIDYAKLALRLGKRRAGLNALRKALCLAPDDADVVGSVVRSMCDEGCLEEAKAAMHAAMFRNSRDGRFRHLWNDFRFHVARLEQMRVEERVTPKAPTILPFLRQETSTAPESVDGKILRRDGAERAAKLPHHLRISGKRHA